MKFIAMTILLVGSFSSLAQGRRDVVVPQVIAFHCLPSKELLTKPNSGNMTVNGTIWLSQKFEAHSLGAAMIVQQAPISARINYSVNGGAMIRNLVTRGNVRIWSDPNSKPEITLFLQPGRLQFRVGEMVGAKGLQPGDASRDGLEFTLNCRSEIY